MATLFIIFISISLIHFFVQGVIVPTLQLEVKDQLLNLRDKVIDLQLKYKKNSQKTVLSNLMNSIEKTFMTVECHSVTLFSLFFIKHRGKINSAEFKENSKRRAISIKDSGIPDIENINKEYYRIVKKVFLSQSAGMLLYVLPFIILSDIIRVLKNSILSVFISKKLNTDNIHEGRIIVYKQFEKTAIDNNPKKTNTNKMEMAYC